MTKGTSPGNLEIRAEIVASSGLVAVEIQFAFVVCVAMTHATVDVVNEFNVNQSALCWAIGWT